MYEAINDIIPRTPEPVVEELTRKLSALIDTCVDFGSNVLLWDIDVKRTDEYNAPIMMTYRHILELIDATSVLIRQSSVDPCKLMLRGILESYFSLAYMLEEDTERRCMAFMVWTMHKKINNLQRADPTSEIGKQFQRKLGKDKLTKNISLPVYPDVEAQKARLESVFEKPAYRPAEEAYQRLRADGVKNPPWYRLFSNNINSVEQLAAHLELMAIYEVFYRDWSGPTHGTDVIQGRVSLDANGGSEIHQLRTPANIQEVAQWVLTLALKVFELFITSRVPDKLADYRRWYQTIQEAYQRISSREPLLVIS